MSDLSPTAEERRRAVRVALRLGVLMLTCGAQADEVERSLRSVLHDLGLEGGDAIISYSTVMVSYVAPGDAEATTAIRAVRRSEPDYGRLAAAAAVVASIRAGATVDEAEAELDSVLSSRSAYPRWLRFAAPALLSTGATLMFGGRLVDAVATLVIGLVIQPALQRIERSELSSFFRVAFGVSATSLLVVLLVLADVPIHGGLVLTGSLLRFLPGAALVSGMHDFIGGALTAGTVRLTEVVLLGAAVAGAASLVLTVGASWGVRLGITTAGRAVWPELVLILAGALAVTSYACQLGVPRRMLGSVAALGAMAVFIGHGLSRITAGAEPQARTFLAALLIGLAASCLAHRAHAPAALWMVPAILPLLPAPATLLPLLATTPEAQDALQGRAVETAFSIGVGAAMGSIVVETLLRARVRVLAPAADALSRAAMRMRLPSRGPRGPR